MSILLAFAVYASAAATAVFPVRSINAGRSYGEAMGSVLAQKYANESRTSVIGPFEAARALGQDSDVVAAAQKLGVAEFITVEAVGLYISRNEKYDFGDNKNITIEVDEDDEEDDPSEQQLLDNHKTILTAVRRSVSGSEIYRAQMTVVTYGDIEESSDRLAKALWHKTSPDSVMNEDNITRRDGLGKNKKYTEKISGVRVGFIQPLDADRTFVPMVSIGYNMKMEQDKFLVDFGVGAMISSSMESDDRSYAPLSISWDIGVAKLFKPGSGAVLPFVGGGLNPFLCPIGLDGPEMGIVPYISAGILSSRAYKSRFFVNLRAGYNLLPVTTQDRIETRNIYGSTTSSYVKHEDRPFEVGLQMGIGW